MDPELKKQLDKIAIEVFGRLYDDLTVDQQQAIQNRGDMYVDYEGKRGVLDEQMSTAQDYMDTPTPQGIEAGGLYVASNPLSHLGRAIRQYRGGKQAQEINEERDVLADRYGRGSQAGAEYSAGQLAKIMRQMEMNQLQEVEPQGQLMDPTPPQPPAPAQPPMAPPPQPQATPEQPGIPLQSAGSVQPGPGSGRGPVPGSPQEWQSYFMRALSQPAGQYAPAPTDRRSREELMRMRRRLYQ